MTVQKVIEAHPSTAKHPARPASSALAALRSRVEAAQGSLDRLRQLAWSLRPEELRGLVTGLEQWDDLRDAVSALLRERPRESLIHALWAAWQRRPRVDEIVILLVEYGDQYGWDTVAGSSYATRARDWVTAETPGHTLQRWLDDQGLSYSDTSSIAQWPLRPDTPLLRLVRDAVLMFGSTAQLRTEGNDRIRTWLLELSPEDRVRFGQNYLTHLPIDEWAGAVLIKLEQSYGLPRKPRIARFWDPIPEPARRAFQRYFIERKVRYALTDNDRYQYWKRWTDEMIDVEFGVAGTVKYAAFDFESFHVVEFFEKDNAAFFYPPEELKRLRRGPITYPSDLKVRMRSYGSGNRLIHRGRWYTGADRMMRRWIRNSRRRS